MSNDMETLERNIRVGDIVLHRLSGLYFKCENKKHERWMNMNKFYILCPEGWVDENYFKKQISKY